MEQPRAVIRATITLGRHAALAILLALSATSCLGDLSVHVTVRNTTDESIILYEGGRRFPEMKVQLPPGGERQTEFMYTQKSSTQILSQVEATDLTGTLIFCRKYTYQDVERLGGVIRIVRGELRCG